MILQLQVVAMKTGVLFFLGTFFGISSLDIEVQLQIAIIIALVAALIIAVWLIYAVVRAQYSKVRTGKEALIGALGIATTDLNLRGEIRVMGEFWQATAAGFPIRKGQKIKVIGLEGNSLMVRNLEEKA
jgi:membrane-bound serine protease (ClpP class)